MKNQTRSNRPRPSPDLLAEYSIFILRVAAISLLDQWSKALVRSSLPLHTPWLPDGMSHLLPHFRLLHVHNSGTIFGFFPGRNLIFLILALAALVVILRILPTISREDWSLRLAVLFQFGGALGNLIDRIRLGYVTDFISISNLPIFNLADISITLGIGILILSLFFHDRPPSPASQPNL